MASTNTVTQDCIFDILSNSRRWMVLAYLYQHEGPIQITDLAEQVAAREFNTDVESLSHEQKQRVYASLYQTHIPKLADAGLIDYDQHEGVKLTTRARINAEDVTPTCARAWHWYYLALAVVSAGVFVLLLADTPRIAAVAPAILGVCVTTAFLLVAGIHYIDWQYPQRKWWGENKECA